MELRGDPSRGATFQEPAHGQVPRPCNREDEQDPEKDLHRWSPPLGSPRPNVGSIRSSWFVSPLGRRASTDERDGRLVNVADGRDGAASPSVPT